MCDSFYESMDYSSHNFGHDLYLVSAEERMAFESTSIEELDQAWKSYTGEYQDEQTRPLPDVSSPMQTLMNYLLFTDKTLFTVCLVDGSTWQGYLIDYKYNSPPRLMTLPKLSYNYNGFDDFCDARDLVNFILSRADNLDLDEDEDPLNFIRTAGENSKSWASILQEITSTDTL